MELSSLSPKTHKKSAGRVFVQLELVVVLLRDIVGVAPRNCAANLYCARQRNYLINFERGQTVPVVANSFRQARGVCIHGVFVIATIGAAADRYGSASRMRYCYMF